MTSKIRRISCFCLTAVMSASLVASSAFAINDGNRAVQPSMRVENVNFEDVTGTVNLTGVAMQNFSDKVLDNAGLSVKNETRTVIVSLDGDSLLDEISQDTSVSEYINTYKGGKALRRIEKEQTNFLNTLASNGIKYEVVYKYNKVVNAVAIRVNTQYLSKIKGIDYVQSAVVSETYAYPEESVEDTGASGGSAVTYNPSNIYATGIYNSEEFLDEYDGSGMTVAVLDTGLDYSHAAFDPDRMTASSLGFEREYIDSLDLSQLTATRLSAERGDSITSDDLYINQKVPFAYDYADHDTDVYPAYSQHGVHVAGIVAGNGPSYTDKDGNTPMESDGNGGERPVEFKGVAPNAQLVICKVFTDDFTSREIGGATTESIVAALEDCVTLGVDVINMSLGTTAGFSSVYLEGDSEGQLLNETYEKIRNQGISLICAASNDFSSGYGSAYGTNLASNPDSGTVGSPSTYNGALSVASINGQYAPYMIADGESVVYYTDASDQNGQRFNFADQMLGDATSGETKKFKYVIIPGNGFDGEYSRAVRERLADKEGYDKVIAVVRRGGNTFQEKVETAKRMGADAIIIDNNVAGSIGVSIGDMVDPIPTISISKDAGNALRYDASGRARTVGELEMSYSNQAGPFMNDYSSWGTTPDLKIKPEITSHGGEITSTVSGGFDEMSGTSMASPNLAGFVALLRGKLKSEHPDWSSKTLTQRVNQIVMSTAVTVYDDSNLPYSPRKQGAGLATLDNVFSTSAYLYTREDEGGAEDDRPKVELGDDKQKVGVYNLTFYVSNEFGSEPLTFRTQSLFMTETLASDNLAVAEKAYMLDDEAAVWKVDNQPLESGEPFSVAVGASRKIDVTLTLSDAEKQYLDRSFVNGMFVEGFIKLISATEGQCDLTIPFMGFYGDWTAAPMLDYSIFELTEFRKDPQYTDENRPQESVYATQPFATYNNERYSIPMGNFLYTQDESAEQIYAEEEHVAVSRFDNYFAEYGEDSLNNYTTANSIRALYAGLLRNAEVVTYDLYDETTGEYIYNGKDYRISKAHSSGGNAIPGNVELHLYPDELGLVNNGKYRLNFHFYFDEDDMDNPDKQSDDNTFSMTFYVDYEAPILVESRIRYYDYKDGNQDRQRVYLDLDVFDNLYAQAVVLCYTDREGDTTNLKLATEYITPIYNANKNGTTTVSIEITDYYENYSGRLYAQIDDYALNHNVYRLDFDQSQRNNLPDEFSIVGDSQIELGVNQTAKIELDYEGSYSPSNFIWTSSQPWVAQVRNGEVFGVSPGTAYITVMGANGTTRRVTVTVVDSDEQLSLPSLSFGTVKNSSDALVKPSMYVDVNAGQTFNLELIPDPWYYPLDLNSVRWESSDDTVASVDDYGNVQTYDKRGEAMITATLMDGNTATNSRVRVTLIVQDPFTVTGGVLTDYHGTGGEVEIPNDRNITAIDSEAFLNNNNITTLIIPKSVRQIEEFAFRNCRALEEVYFIQKTPQLIPDANLSLIMQYAFVGCTNLKKIDLSNTKTITVDTRAFADCANLQEVVKMEHIGTMNAYAFSNTALTSVNISGLHNTGVGVFAGCTALEEVITDNYTSIGNRIFSGCTALEEITINSPVVEANAFYNCENLTSVRFGGENKQLIIGSNAFYNCENLTEVDFGENTVKTIGDYAFANCASLSSIELTDGVLCGLGVFNNTQVNYTDNNHSEYLGAIYSGTTLVQGPSGRIPSTFEIRSGTTEIADGAFSGRTFDRDYDLVIPDSVTEIGASAFDSATLRSVILPQNLTEIPNYAFRRASLNSLEIPASVTTISSYAFSNSRISSVTFADGRENALNIESAAFMNSAITQIALPELVSSNGRVVLNASVFAGCSSLTDIDLQNVTEIGMGAFAGCSALTEIDLKNVTVIGDNAFGEMIVNYSTGATRGCTRLASVIGMENVTEIGEGAFYNAPLTSIRLDSAVSIGARAFFGAAVTQVNIPESLVNLGSGAFAAARNLLSFTVTDNDNFFVESGALYRVISGTRENGAYELCAYPAARIIPIEDTVRVFAVKEGTIVVGANSFRRLAADAITEVRFPYSVKQIGDAAFYESNISSYVFESIQAPTLLSDSYDVSDITGAYGYFNVNFNDAFIYHGLFDSQFNRVESQINISYPSNGIGYDNYIYTYYFGPKTTLGELMDDTTRALKTEIEALESAQTVAGWNSWAVTAENFRIVSEFSERVKAAHATYNSISSATQLEYLGADNVQKIFDIEAELGAVKRRFNIPVAIRSLGVSADSTHKTNYKVGEAFDITGLKLIVNYDDYSSEEADMSLVTLADDYSSLTIIDNYVTLRYRDRTVEVEISVTEEGEVIEPPIEEGGCASCKSSIEAGIISSVALSIVIAVYAAVVIIKRKNCYKKDNQ